MLRYVTPVKKIRDQRVRAHLLFLIFLTIVRVWARISIRVKSFD